nr:reverse transcriptase domain-containing protein [Tanacetum cinerariifolium]
MPGPEHPPSPDYVPGTEYPEYLVPSDDEEDPEEDPINYPADGGDDDEEDDNGSFEDDDDEEEEASKEDEDEDHLASADSIALHAINPIPSAEDTEAFETNESVATPPSPPQTIVPVSVIRHHRARISVRPHTSLSPSTKVLIVEYASAPTPPSPPPSPLSPLSSSLPRISSPPQHTSPTYDEAPLGYKAAMIYIRAYESIVLTTVEEVWAQSKDRSRTMEARIGTLEAQKTTTRMTDDPIKQLISQGVADAFAKYEANIGSSNGDDSHDFITGRRRHVTTTRTKRRRQVSTIRECTYTDFLKCQPMNFKGTEGVFNLTQWLEKMESVFHISTYTVACQVKCATCTLQVNDLTWWNSHVRVVRHDVAYAMPWKTLKKMMTDKYCPRSEIKKLETKKWNLMVKGTDVPSYNRRFQELALMCDMMFLEESNVIKKYVGGLPDMIHESVKASKPKTIQEAIEFATELMDEKVLTIVERQTENKRKFEDTSKTTKTNNSHEKAVGRDGGKKLCTVYVHSVFERGETE